MAEDTELAPIGGNSEATVGQVGEPAPAQDAPGEPTEVQEDAGPAIKYYYNPKKNARDEAFAGVPQRDLTEDEVRAYPRWLQKALAGAKFYQAEPAEEAE